MSFTFDPTTSAGRVRLLITDIVEATPIFQDAEIDAFLAIEGDSIHAAASTALLVMAANEALVSKRIEVLDLKTDGPAVAESLRKLATDYRKTSEEQGSFAIAAMIDSPSAWRERIRKNAMRSGL